MSQYLIGIDLGTTNSALAYIEVRGGKAKAAAPTIRHFPIPQLVAAGEAAPRELLPSFLYLPGAHDLPPGATSLPWEGRAESREEPESGAGGQAGSLPHHPAPHGARLASCVVGEFARNHGARVPGRLITSAKSWLCHAGVDRSAPLLPWTAPPDVPRISPVEASARCLRHIAQAWNFVMARDDPSARLEKQQVVLTVPASFDDMARTLTVEAARQAGLENVTLLEEPLAAFYCWLATRRRGEGEKGRKGEGETNTPTHKPDSPAPFLPFSLSPPLGSLMPGDCCLVVDVGGGTSDFSLIQAAEHEGQLTFVRQAVGDHLLLGGDNMDLALARFIETRLPPSPYPLPPGGEGRVRGPDKLDAVQYGMLTQACRQAKETLLGPSPPESYSVTVMGRGRQVIGGSLHASLTPVDVRNVILDGFFPIVSAEAVPQRGARTGLHEMGLPYVSDPAITRHLADFLHKHLTPSMKLAAILFNGGVFTPKLLRDRIVEVLLHWFNREERRAEPREGPDSGAREQGGSLPPHPAPHGARLAGPWQPLVLTTPSLDLAVAWGAAHFAWLKHTGGRRIGGGMARSYYVGIQAGRRAEPREGPDTAPNPAPHGARLAVLCVVPQHLEEGREIALTEPELELALGQPVSFPLYTSTVRAGDKPGDVIQVAPDQLLQLPPLHTVLRGGKRSGTKSVPVTLAVRCTEIGTLELWCVAREGSNRWKLEFNVRDIVKEDPEPAVSHGPAIGQVADVWPEETVQGAAQLLRAVYAPESKDEGGRMKDEGKGKKEETKASFSSFILHPSSFQVSPQNLTKALEASLQAGRDKWPTSLCRRLWEFLAEVADHRRKSPAHLSRWFNLTGFCLRPGFGDSLDKFRVEQLWKLLHFERMKEEGGKMKEEQTKRPGSSFILHPSSLSSADYWIMMRRIAGGLSAGLQNTLYQRLRPVLVPAKGKNVFRPGANELAEMWRAIASLERLDVKQKELLAQAILKVCRRSPVPSHGFFALTRLGARVLLYGPFNAVVHPEIVQTWLDAILDFTPGNASERLAWGFCLTQLARRSGQRALDIDDDHRQRVLKTLRSASVPAHWSRMVEDVLELEGEEQSQMFGESLPIGLRLARADE